MPTLSPTDIFAIVLFIASSGLLAYAVRRDPTPARRAAVVLAVLSVVGGNYLMLTSYAGEPALTFDKSGPFQRNGSARGGAADSSGDQQEGSGRGGQPGEGGSGQGLISRVAALMPTAKPVAQAGEGISDCDDCPEMVLIRPGFYRMGASPDDAGALANERPVRTIRISKAFAIGRTEITVGQYVAFVRDTKAAAPRCANSVASADPAVAVSCVSWREAQAYVAWLRGKTGKAFRLPTEAEWEYAARAGATTPYATGTHITPEQANVGRKQLTRTAAGSSAQNSFGLADMHGGVAEMVADCWSETLKSRSGEGRLPLLRGDCARRVLRDAAANEAIALSRLSARRALPADARHIGIGFRVARDF